jgi:hypothetical protein
MIELILLTSIATAPLPSPSPVITPVLPPVHSTPASGSGSRPVIVSQTPPQPQQQQPKESWADKMLKGIQERIRR